MGKSIIPLSAYIESAGSVVGRHEHDGPLGALFDMHDESDRFGMDSWEKSESEMQRIALSLAFKKSGLREEDIGALFAGDLLNQCVGSAYGLMSYNIPYFGLYGACSTAAEGLMLAAVVVSGGLYARAAAVTSSHNCSAERQYRTPIEYGAQRPPTAQWTVTGAGAFILGGRSNVKITAGLPGIVEERGIKDANNMGAAMAPAAVSTLRRYFDESGSAPQDYDLIVTGDLGAEGGPILCDMMRAQGCDISGVYGDCGMMIYDLKRQDMHAGGSGCGCSAVVLAAQLLGRLSRGELKKILFIGTGAMMSPSSIQQGLAIPAVAHLLRLEHEDNR